MNGATCPRNLAARDEDPSPPFRISYIPCRQPAYADVYGRGGATTTFCREHALEAERDGATVDWPEDA